MLLVIGRTNERRGLAARKRRRLEFLQPLDRLADDAALVSVLGRQIEQDRRYPGVDQVNIGPLPVSLTGSGAASLVLTVYGQTGNTVTLMFQ